MKLCGIYRAAAFAVIAWLLLVQTSSSGQTGVSSEPQQFRMSLIVTDRRTNRSVENVRQENIQITEDGQPLAISFFEKDERPVRCVVAIDTSGSFRPLLQAGINVAKALIANKRADDEMMVAAFVGSNRIETVQTFTTDSSVLLESLKPLVPGGGQSAVIDAVYLAVTAAAERQAGNPGVRPVVVLITDGEDRLSFYTQDQLKKLLRGHDVQIFTVGLVVRLDKEPGVIRRSPRERAEKLLVDLAEETGGRVFFPNNDKELSEATAQIFLDLRLQYLLGFKREVKPGEKGFRKVKASVVNDPQAKNLVAITRRGYLVGPKEPAKGTKSK